MKQLFRFVAVYIFSVSLSTVFALETVNWDIGNNTVTYSDSISNLGAFENAVSLSLSKFNSTDAVEAGEVAGTYTLTKVVITVDGSISGIFTYNNAASTSRNVISSRLSGDTAFSFEALANTASESFAYTVPDMPIVMEGNSTTTRNYSSAGAGGSTEITDALKLLDFTGTGSFEGYVSLAAFDTTAKQADITSGLTAFGSAAITVSYYYDSVPEPSTLALLGFGCAALLTRRRRKPALDC